MIKIDPITTAVLINNLYWVTEEMNVYLAKSAFSTNIKVRRDCSCALYTKNGEMLAQGEFIPVHLGVMSQTLKEILKDYPLNTLSEGDQIIHNDPYRMGSHLPDVMLFKPIFYKGKLIAFAGNLAHHVDVGGSSTKWNNPTIFEEGIRLPPIKIIKKGKMQEDIYKIITANVRTPHEVKGDLAAQTAANYRGEERLKELARKYGVTKLLEYFEVILNYSEKCMREALRIIPDGEAFFEDYIENDGITDNKIKIRVNISIKDSNIFLNFSGSGGPGKGGYNSPWSITHSAAYCAIKSVVGSKIPTNSGAYRPIHLIRPKQESIVDARFPRAVGGCTCSPSQRIVDVIIGALSKIIPEKTCACDGHWPAASFVGIDSRTGLYSSYVETYACGRGAKYNDDGADAHQTHMTNTANAPIEIIELEHPLKVDKYAIVSDSGGAGKFRGGVGITREFTISSSSTMSVSTKPMRQKNGPYGLYNGEKGKTDLCGIKLSNGEFVTNSKQIKTGDKVIIQSSGGGGWGNPIERDIKKVEWDVLNGYISVKAAREKYGCVIDKKTLKCKIEKTKKLRESTVK